MNDKVKRYLIVMAISVALNEILSFAIEPLNLPLWLDMVGTALAALVLEPTAGLFVGYINNFFIAVFRYDASSIIYFAVSASVALLVGLLLKDKKKITFKKILTTLCLVILVTSCISCILTMWRSGGVSNLEWEAYFYNMAAQAGMPVIISCFFGAFIVKIPDMIVSAIILAMVYKLLPKKWKEDQNIK